LIGVALLPFVLMIARFSYPAPEGAIIFTAYGIAKAMR
jgi:hypothetical protein